MYVLYIYNSNIAITVEKYNGTVLKFYKLKTKSTWKQVEINDGNVNRQTKKVLTYKISELLCTKLICTDAAAAATAAKQTIIFHKRKEQKTA